MLSNKAAKTRQHLRERCCGCCLALELRKQFAGIRTKLPLQHLIDVLKRLGVHPVLQHFQCPAHP